MTDADLAEIDAGMVAQPAFHRAAGQVVLHAVAEVNVGRTVVVADRHGDGDQALGPLAALAEGIVEAEEIRHAIELGGCHGKDRVSQELVAHGSFLSEDRGMPTNRFGAGEAAERTAEALRSRRDR